MQASRQVGAGPESHRIGVFILFLIRVILDMGAEEYEAWVASTSSGSQQFQSVRDGLIELCQAGGSILHFSHHDLDGVTSAAIIKLGLEKLGATIHTRLPMGFQLSEADVRQQLKETGTVDAILVTDRGSDNAFDEIAELEENVILIDHHPSRNPAKECLWYNPSISDGDQTSTAHLCHMLATSLGISSIYLDFYGLLGCRGDFAFDPVTLESGIFVQPFIQHAKRVLPNLFEVFEGRPTRYDVAFRDRTTRINQIAEVLNASCFAHNYSTRSRTLTNVYGPYLCLQILRKAESDSWALRGISFTDLGDWLRDLDQGEVLSEVYRLYLEDWSKAMDKMEHLVHIGSAGETAMYLITGTDLPLLPLAASIKLHELKRSRGDDVLILVFHENSYGVNISARGTGLKIHCGFLMNALANRMNVKFGLGDGVSGGGHAKAGECIASVQRVSREKILRELTALVQEISLMDDLYKRGTLPRSGYERADDLGLKYMSRSMPQ